jgi:hypothetical protein
MKIYISLLIGFTFMINPTITGSKIDEYEMVSRCHKKNITLYGKKMNGLYKGFKIDFKGSIYTKPFWISETNPTYAPQIFYTDINRDQRRS